MLNFSILNANDLSIFYVFYLFIHLTPSHFRLHNSVKSKLHLESRYNRSYRMNNRSTYICLRNHRGYSVSLVSCFNIFRIARICVYLAARACISYVCMRCKMLGVETAHNATMVNCRVVLFRGSHERFHFNA